MWVAGYSAAGDAARTLRPDGTVRHGSWALTVLDVQRTPVCIAAVGDLRSLPDGDDLLLLGSAHGTALLLQPGVAPVVHRVPAGTFTMRSRAANACR